MTELATTQRHHTGLVVAGYLLAFLLPLGGFICGIALARRRTGHAVAIMAISFVIGAFWLLILWVLAWA